MAAQSIALKQAIYSIAALLALFVAIFSAALYFLLRESRANQKLLAAEEWAMHVAFHDALTKLPNRAMFYRRATEVLKNGRTIAVALIDLDEFKKVNDTYGHLVGDALLSEVANRISETSARHGGVAARLGGDEFVVWFEDVATDLELSAFSANLLEAARRPILAEGTSLTSNVSIGTAASTSEFTKSESSLSVLLRAADKALYEAKREGKNRVAHFTQDLANQLHAEAALSDALNTAIAEDALTIALQPQVNMNDRKIVSFEVLSRWVHEGETVPPDVFIAIAEKVGSVRDVDKSALRSAVRLMAAWRGEGCGAPKVSVNLSAAHFRDNDIVVFVRDLLERHSVEAADLTLEVTETMLVEDWDRARFVIDGLHSIGVRLALDDFGTGYSSLGYLRRLPVQELKLDKSLVADCEKSPQNPMLLSAIRDLALALDMTLVVEGIETEAQEDLLKRCGFGVGQGYLYSSPVDVAQARRMFEGELSLPAAA